MFYVTYAISIWTETACCWTSLSLSVCLFISPILLSSSSYNLQVTAPRLTTTSMGSLEPYMFLSFWTFIIFDPDIAMDIPMNFALFIAPTSCFTVTILLTFWYCSLLSSPSQIHTPSHGAPWHAVCPPFISCRYNSVHRSSDYIQEISCGMAAVLRDWRGVGPRSKP